MLRLDVTCCGAAMRSTVASASSTWFALSWSNASRASTSGLPPRASSAIAASVRPLASSTPASAVRAPTFIGSMVSSRR